MNSPQISVVIPVFNGEKYLTKTLESVIKQSFTDFEVLCINDCSMDSSLEILNDFAGKDARIHVISTSSNQGNVPNILKNYVLPQLKGLYFIYASQDDLFSDDWLEKLIARALETEADAVLPDLVFFHDQEPSKDYALIGIGGNRAITLSNRDAVILSLDWQIPGNALWKTELIKRIGFADFNAFADEYSVRVFFFHCNKVVFGGGTFFYRQDNPEAITKKISVRTFDRPFMHFMLYQFLRDNHFPDELCSKELFKSINSLISRKQLLLRKNSNFSKHDYEESDKRLHQCFTALSNNREVLIEMKKQKSILAMILGYTISANCYTAFNIISKAQMIIKRL